MLAITEAAVGAFAAFGVASVAAVASVISAWLTHRANRNLETGDGTSLGRTVYSNMLRGMHLEEAVAQVDIKVSQIEAKVVQASEAAHDVSARLDVHLQQVDPVIRAYLTEHPEITGGSERR